MEVVISENRPRKNSPFLQFIGRLMSRIMGWKITGEMANEKKIVLALAPHSSNWDFFMGVPLMWGCDLNVSIFMKREAFFWPFKTFLQYIGFVPINRQAADGIVGSAVEQFSERDEFWLAITPEGTRKQAKWKSGFLRISQQANVPIQIVGIDYAHKRFHFGAVINASGDTDHDLNFCIEYSSQFKGKFS